MFVPDLSLQKKSRVQTQDLTKTMHLRYIAVINLWLQPAINREYKPVKSKKVMITNDGRALVDMSAILTNLVLEPVINHITLNTQVQLSSEDTSQYYI